MKKTICIHNFLKPQSLLFEWSLLIFLAFLCFAFALILTVPAYAQEASLSISPTVLEIEASRPSTTKKNFNIKNLTRDGIDLEIQLIPFTQSALQNGEAELIFDKTRAQDTRQFLRKNAKIFDGNEEINTIMLSPLQEKTLTLSIALEKDQKVYDHYFSILFTKKALEKIDSKNQSSKTRIIPGIATNVIFSIASSSKRSALIEKFSAPLFLSSGPVPFAISIKNNTSKYIKPYGNIIIKNMFGQAIGKIELKPLIILSKTTRRITNLSETNKSLNYDSQQSPKIFTYWKEPVLLGVYSANLNLVSGPDSEIFSRTVYFIGFPVSYILGISISIITLLFIIGKIRAKRRI